MKTVKYLAIIIVFLVSFPALAICPTQQTTIFFANGVNVDREGPDGAEDSRVALKTRVLEKGVSPECVVFALAYNTNEFFLNDFVQAIIQKTAEKTGVDNFPWGQWLHPESATDWFESVVQDALFTPARITIAGGRWIFGDQRDEHIAAYETELSLGRKIILAAHSQGTINAKEERTIMTPAEQLNVNIVAAAAFSLPEPDETRYTTIDRDNLTVGGGGIYTTPEANIFLTLDEHSECFQDITPSFPFFDCHGFLQTYMRILRSRDKYVADIIALLPAATPSGTIEGFTFIAGCGGEKIISPNIAVQSVRESDGQLVAETVSDSLGFYHMILPAGTYFIGFGELVTIIPEQTVQHDVSIPIAC